MMRLQSGGERGYILPATILLGVAITIVMALFFQVITASSRDLNNQSFHSIAQEAALSGVDYAVACVKAGTESWPTPLTQQTKCVSDGVDNSSSMLAVGADGSWRSSFSVSSPQTVTGYTSGARKIVSKGTVERLQGGVPVGTPITVTKVSIFDSTTTVLPASTGESATDIKSDDHTCSINNGNLYCWGQNTYGELGVGDIGSRAAPTLVGGLLTGKYVSKVAIGDANTCAIADGEAYCWGDGGNGILGNGSLTNSTVPVHVGGALAAKKVTDIGVSSTSWPLPQVLPTMHHACALTDGGVYCWGGNEYLQMGNQVCVTVFVTVCNIDNGFPPSSPLNILYTTPVPVFGHDAKSNSNSSPIYGNKLDRVGTGGHFSCGITQGEMYCWGMRLPAVWGMPKPATILSGPYTMPGANDGLNIDPNSFELTGDSACGMAAWKFNCMGYTPAFSGIASFLTAYFLNAPITLFSGFDIQSHDNGQLPVFFVGGVVAANYCAVAGGQAGCVAAAGGADGSGGFGGIFGSTQFKPVSQNGSPSIMGKSPTKIAAGGTFGSLIANGQLFTWGTSIVGQVGNGSFTASVPYPSQIATGVLGTNPGTYAANGTVAAGGSHGCGVVNGILFCWGNNTSGQLGDGTTAEGVRPAPPKGFDGMTTTKVSAGKDHTCAISDGKLFCWGRNNYGQLGNGNTTSPIIEPTQVTASGLNNKRITDVSAGEDSTCAIADGEAFCWGRNNLNQLGNAAAGSQSSTPRAVNGLTGKAVTSIAVGVSHACAISGGDGYCWGANANYATGLGTNSGTTATATKITGGGMNTKSAANELTPMFTQISAGNGFSCAIINSFAHCWGKGASGQTGTNTTSDVMYPTRIAAGASAANTRQATSISAGNEHACATLQGSVYCWGRRDSGRLGNNDLSGTGPQTVPVKTTGATADSNKAINISVGESSACSVSNGKILCWGNTANHRTGNESPPPVWPEATGILDFVMYQPYQRGPIF